MLFLLLFSLIAFLLSLENNNLYRAVNTKVLSQFRIMSVRLKFAEKYTARKHTYERGQNPKQHFSYSTVPAYSKYRSVDRCDGRSVGQIFSVEISSITLPGVMIMFDRDSIERSISQSYSQVGRSVRHVGLWRTSSVRISFCQELPVFLIP